MNRVALLLGGNQGDRRALLKQATELIRDRIGAVVSFSRIHETEPWGAFEEADGRQKVENFLNQALLVETSLSAHEVLEEALLIEALLGRLRPATPGQPLHAVADVSHRLYHSRPMDIDLIFWNDEVIDLPDLQIPHPRAHLRRFVLEPLAEIMPDYVHPTLGLTVRELLAR